MDHYIYLLLRTEEMKGYVGKSIDPQSRFNHHWKERCKGKRTYNKNWLASLSEPPQLVILEECSEDEWPQAERSWICDLRAGGLQLTNTAPGGKGGRDFGTKQPESFRAFMKGRKHGIGNKSRTGQLTSAETREKLSKAGKGKKRSNETRDRIRNARLGTKHSKETKENISKALLSPEVNVKLRRTRPPRSEESKRQQSLKMSGRVPWNKGRPWSNEVKAKMRLGHQSRPPRSEEVKRRQSLRMKGENNPFFGRRHTEETKAKISASKKGSSS